MLIGSLILTLFLGGCVINTSIPASVAPPSQPATAPQINWSELNLSGRLVYLSGYQQNNTPLMRIQALDLENGTISTIYQAPPLGWIYSALVSPDEKQIVMAYSPPTGYQTLYILPLNGSLTPRQLFSPPSQNDQYLEPVWSPDGQYVYFVHANYSLPTEEPNQRYPLFEIYRMAYPAGPLEKIVDQAYWPRLSADASRLLYVSSDPDDGINKLFIANPDGSGAQQVVMSGAYIPTIIDAPDFLPDGKSILFSAPVPARSSVPSWLDLLSGVITASAHSIPSEWWSVPVGGGVPTKLTHIQAIGLYASISADNRHIASFSGNGVFVMNPDGTGLSMLVSDVGGIPGTVSWIP